jgi:hypothetical protein
MYAQHDIHGPFTIVLLLSDEIQEEYCSQLGKYRKQTTVIVFIS